MVKANQLDTSALTQKNDLFRTLTLSIGGGRVERLLLGVTCGDPFNTMTSPLGSLSAHCWGLQMTSFTLGNPLIRSDVHEAGAHLKFYLE